MLGRSVVGHGTREMRQSGLMQYRRARWMQNIALTLPAPVRSTPGTLRSWSDSIEGRRVPAMVLQQTAVKRTPALPNLLANAMIRETAV